MAPAIKATGLGKRYRIGGARPAYRTLRDTITDAVVGPFRKLRDLLAGNPSGAAGLREEIWAFDDVSFEIEPGEAVGLIGRNGAGKSTLLKILAKITEPTRGRVEIRGRTGALLEVGTGFHLELTGRENIHLSGAILGMSRREIAAKLGAIVEFAEIGTFIETPVKHYSSGMFVRLAFSVAAHLEPDILLVDEVLAVGDAAFQRKCLDRLNDLTGGGRTVMFVSHNMAAVSALCDRALWLEGGRVAADGSAGDAIDAYLSALSTAAGIDLAERTDRSGSGASRLVELRIEGPGGVPTEDVMSGARCSFVLVWKGDRPLRRPRFKVTVFNRHGQAITQLDSTLVGDAEAELPAEGSIRCEVPRLPLSSGRYRLNVFLDDKEGLLDRVEGAAMFSVSEGDFYGTGRSIQDLWDVCLVEQDWRPDAET